MMKWGMKEAGGIGEHFRIVILGFILIGSNTPPLGA